MENKLPTRGRLWGGAIHDDELALAVRLSLRSNSFQADLRQANHSTKNPRLLDEDLKQTSGRIGRLPYALFPTLQSARRDVQQLGKHGLRHRRLCSHCRQRFAVDLRCHQFQVQASISNLGRIAGMELEGENTRFRPTRIVEIDTRFSVQPCANV